MYNTYSVKALDSDFSFFLGLRIISDVYNVCWSERPFNFKAKFKTVVQAICADLSCSQCHNYRTLVLTNFAMQSHTNKGFICFCILTKLVLNIQICSLGLVSFIFDAQSLQFCPNAFNFALPPLSSSFSLPVYFHLNFQFTFLGL